MKPRSRVNGFRVAWLRMSMVALMLGLVSLTAFAGPRGQGASGSTPQTLDVTWTIDSHYGKVGGWHTVLQAQYELWDVSKFKWVTGKIVNSEASWEGQKAVYRFVSPAEQLGNVSDEVLQGRIKWAGEIRATEDGNAQIELDVLPMITGVSGPTDEAKGCGEEIAGRFELSQDDLRTLRTGPVTLKMPGDRNPAPGCSYSRTVEIKMPTIELKYGETNLDVAKLFYPGTAIDPQVLMEAPITGEELPKGFPRVSWVEHGNFAGEVWVNGENKVKVNTGAAGKDEQCAEKPKRVTSDYLIDRKVQSWIIDASGEPTATPLLPWHDDSNCPTQDWLDNPGNGFNGPPDTWGHAAKTPKGTVLEPTGTLDEFMVEVDGRPECGCVYAAFAIQIKPKAYRIKYSTPEAIDKTEWKSRESDKKLHADLKFTASDKWTELEEINGKWRIKSTGAKKP